MILLFIEKILYISRHHTLGVPAGVPIPDNQVNFNTAYP